MTDDLQALIPKGKSDVETARAAVEAGYPKVAPILPQLFVWMQDFNWPVAHVLAPFFVSIGAPILVEIRRVLGTDDGMWKYWALMIAESLPSHVRVELRPDLLRIVEQPTPDETVDGVAESAAELLALIDGDT